MALDAILFDVDGTLIDTNASHSEAWMTALNAHGYHVARDRIDVEMGKGGDKLVTSVLGAQAEKEHGDALRKAHGEAFTKIAQSRQFAVFPGAEALIAEVRRRGIKTAIATSSKKDMLKLTQTSAKVDLAKWVDHVITADDAKESKPSPHLLTAAAEKLKSSPAQCLMVGDTPYDIDASRDSGMACFGVLCGKMNDEKTLHAAGARAVYQDPAAMLARLDEALEIASPGPSHMTWAMIHSLMQEAIGVARDAMDHGEAPIGCVLARGNGTVIARGYNELNTSQNKTAHAEIVTFAKAAGKVPADARDLVLVSTLEPCVMCLGAAMEAAVNTILYALPAPADGGTARVRPPQSPESQMPRILGHIMEKESRDLFKEFLRRGPSNPEQIAFATQLLKMT
jgi:HAD superfamily hydrolase (TIGR01509 family)